MKATIALCVLFAALHSTTLGAPTYPIVDTGQTTAYGSYPGQDGHYQGAQPAYKNNGDGTVTDQVTGLMWTKDPGEKMTLAEAEKNAAKCRVGGYSDWRLPTIKELYSLIQLNGTDPDPMSSDTSNLEPFIDASVFDFQYGDPAKGERIIDSQFATSTRYVSTTMNGNETMFGVNFADGRIKGYPIKTRRGEGRYYVLYVRENPAYGNNKFEDNGDGTVTDEATGLTWMKKDSGDSMDWPAALAYAENLELAGHDDWRLPNAKELQSIIDYTRSPDTTDSAAIDPVFECTPITNEGGRKDYAHYWTGTTHVSSRGTDTAVYFAFGRSLGWMGPDGNKQLMDVHGAGSQRSDPKVGDASRFPYGRGPQGDVIRIDNMVRLVRGGGVEGVTAETAPESPARQRPGQPTENQAQGRRNRGAPSADRMFSRFDTDNNGLISKVEFKGPERRFNILDQNHDGKITREEIESAPPPPNRRERQPQGDTPRPFEEPVGGSEKRTVPPVSGNNTSKPNIVFIYADDMGWTGTSVEMIKGDPDTRSDFYQTPNLEKLASKGMVFSQAYSPGSMCTPSRVGVLTGKTPAEMHITTPGGGRSDDTKKLITPQIARGLADDVPTIGTLLKAEGYATALLGKWHIGRGDHAGHHGFDVHDGSTENHSGGNADDPKEIFSLTQRGIEFMEQNVRAGNPFYLQLSHYAVHIPIQSRSESISRFEEATSGSIHTQADYAGMTWDLDASLDLIFQALEKLKIANNTYIVFMSDNGAGGNRRKPNNAPLFMGKGSLYEGGIRIPFIVNGPGVKTGYCAEPVSGTDLFATFAAWAGIKVQSDESEDLSPLLAGNASEFERRKELLFHFPHYGQGPAQKPQSAVIQDDFKLILDWESDSVQLYNLTNDLGEQHDLAKTNPEKAAELRKQLEQRLNAVDAQRPRPNPDYDPAEAPPVRRRRQIR